MCPGPDKQGRRTEGSSGTQLWYSLNDDDGNSGRSLRGHSSWGLSRGAPSSEFLLFYSELLAPWRVTALPHSPSRDPLLCFLFSMQAE